MVISSHFPPFECPYRAALSAYETARHAGVRVEAKDNGEALRIVGGTPEAREQLRRFAGVLVFDLETPEGREAQTLYGLGGEAFGGFRSKVDGSTLTVVDLHDPMRRALVRLVQAPDQTAREMLTQTAATLRELPLPWTLELERVPQDVERKHWRCERVRFVVTTSASSYKAAVAAGRPAFVARELEAMALAVEVERAWPRDLDAWLAAKKRHANEWRLVHEHTGALDVRGVIEATKSTRALGEVLDVLGAELVSAVVHEKKGGG